MRFGSIKEAMLEIPALIFIAKMIKSLNMQRGKEES